MKYKGFILKEVGNATVSIAVVAATIGTVENETATVDFIPLLLYNKIQLVRHYINHTYERYKHQD
jgi:hypothetical protein